MLLQPSLAVTLALWTSMDVVTTFLSNDFTNFLSGYITNYFSIYYITNFLSGYIKNFHSYSRVHISSDSLFSKILKKSFMVHKKMIPHMNGLLFFIRWSKFFFFFWKNKFKMAASKKPHFPAPPILNIFSWKFHGWVLGLVELIDAKGIGMT